MLFTVGLNWVNNGQNIQSDLRINFHDLLFIQDQKSMLTSQLQPALFSSCQSDFCTLLQTKVSSGRWNFGAQNSAAFCNSTHGGHTQGMETLQVSMLGTLSHQGWHVLVCLLTD